MNCNPYPQENPQSKETPKLKFRDFLFKKFSQAV